MMSDGLEVLQHLSECKRVLDRGFLYVFCDLIDAELVIWSHTVRQVLQFAECGLKLIDRGRVEECL